MIAFKLNEFWKDDADRAAARTSSTTAFVDPDTPRGLGGAAKLRASRRRPAFATDRLKDNAALTPARHKRPEAALRGVRAMDDLIADFVAECREMLEALGGEIVAWEAQPDDRARLDSIFRFVHTVKGNCGFFEFPRLEALSHAAEDALADVRAGRRVPDGALVSAVLASSIASPKWSPPSKRARKCPPVTTAR